MLNGDILEAQNETIAELVSDPQIGRSYAFLGDVALHFEHDNYSDYSRVLDMQNATVSVSYTVDGVVFTRNFFASYPDQVMVGKVSSTEKGTLSFSASWDRIGLDDGTRNGSVYSNGSNAVTVNAELAAGPPHYAGQLSITNTDGECRQ